MVFEQIENLKRQYTDKYVVVDGSRPELARFDSQVGQVRTVNMSGRALVEFLDYHKNTGWYDISLDFLKIVDKPEAVAKPAAKKKPPAKSAAKKEPAAEKPPGKMSVAEMLAAARGEKKPDATASAPATEKPAPAKKEAPKPAPAEASATTEKPTADRAKMSVADMLAAARGEKSGAKPASAPPAGAPAASAAPPAEPAAVEEPPAEVEEVAPESAEAPVVESPTPAAGGEKVDRSSMSVEDIIRWCREHDSK